MKHIFLLFSTALLLVGCDRTFEQRTAKCAEVRELHDDRAAVLAAAEEGSLWGFVDSEGHLVVECRYLTVGDFAEGLASAQLPGGRFGYITPDGKWAITPAYDTVGNFDDGLAWVTVSGLTGRIDTGGNAVIACLYTRIDEPDERGWMPACRDGKWGRLLYSGREVIPCRYDRIGEVDANGLVRVWAEGRQGLLDAEGREVLGCNFSYISEFRNGYARTNLGGNQLLSEAPRGGLWGLVDSLGKELIPCHYASLGEPSEGLLAFRTEGSEYYGYLDLQGTEILRAQYAVARPFVGGVAVVSYNKVEFGLVDANGNEQSSFRYRLIGEFRDGLAPFNLDPFGLNFPGMSHRCGYLDHEGREVIPVRYDDAQAFREMRAAVMRYGVDHGDFYDARWSYITPSGELIADYKYHEAHPFSCGLARVFIAGQGYGFIDRQGREVVPCKYDQAEDYRDFRARVRQAGHAWVLDETGAVVSGD